jgi:hypothetical protein
LSFLNIIETVSIVWSLNGIINVRVVRLLVAYVSVVDGHSDLTGVKLADGCIV